MYYNFFIVILIEEFGGDGNDVNGEEDIELEKSGERNDGDDFITSLNLIL
jgi:hypothetical protein